MSNALLRQLAEPNENNIDFQVDDEKCSKWKLLTK